MSLIVVRTGSIVFAFAAILGIACSIFVPARALAEQGERRLNHASVARALPERNPRLLQTPLTEVIDISAQLVAGERLAECRVAGHVTLWVSRPLRVLDDKLEEQAIVEAGLLQFGKGSTLEGCSADSATLDLSDQFANFVIAEGGAYRQGMAMALASQLAQDFFHLAQPDGTPVPLVDIKVSASGSGAHEYTIVLIRDAERASFDAVIHRETAHMKFAPRVFEGE